MADDDTVLAKISEPVDAAAVVGHVRHPVSQPRAAAITQDECVRIANEVVDGAVHRLPVLAHALVHYLCDGIPPNASVHEATQHIAHRGVGVLRRLPVEANGGANETVAVASVRYRAFVVGAALCGVGLARGIACSAAALLLIYNRLGPARAEKRGGACAALAWIAACAWWRASASASAFSKLDVTLALAAMVVA